MATIPQEELTTLGVIHQDLVAMNASVKSNGGAIVGLGAMLAQMNTLLQQLLIQGRMEQADLDKLVADFTDNAVGFAPTMDQPVNQTGVQPMGHDIHFGMAGSGGMMDDQKGLIHSNPQDSAGTGVPLPTGVVPTWTIAPGTAATLDGSVDPSGVTIEVVGVKGQAGVEVITVSAALPGGGTITGTYTLTTTVDPSELAPTQFGPTMDMPVAQ